MQTNIQINIAIPKHWKIELERLARKQSVIEDKTLTYVDLIRRAVSKEYTLSQSNNE